MGTRYPGTAKEIRALNAYITLVRAAESVAGRVSRGLAVARLTVSQFGTLEALYHLGPMCQRDLGRKILKSSGNITLVVDNLERRGLVRRERGSEDRRFVSVHLTDRGKNLVRKVLPNHLKAIVKEMDVLPAAKQEELRRLCRALGLGESGPAGRGRV